ncbi:MAG: ORF6N domain-containing protein [Zetaproteobacteria bacterium]|nr:ORF6N domain-containing protein [Zetaproteobacteria bacterium]
MLTFEAVRDNPDRFPDDYIIELNRDEWQRLKSKYSSSIKGGKVKLPKSFTEKGLYIQTYGKEEKVMPGSVRKSSKGSGLAPKGSRSFASAKQALEVDGTRKRALTPLLKRALPPLLSGNWPRPWQKW